ncbi:MAG TPA: hypothetical protein VMU50_21330 [Polyangia bacterium]|nr:hypothetical protein [Polyangia bacterium]
MGNVRVRALKFLAALTTIFVATAAVPARASLMVPLDLTELVRRSDHIAVADVVSVQAAWDAKHERILSTIKLSVVEAWKGSATPATRITIVQPGGTVGDITMVVFGMSQFQPGERALLFLRGTMGAAAVVGMTQGKRPVTRDLATGKWMAQGPDRSGVVFTRPVGSGDPAAAVATPESALRPRTLDEIHEDVRTLIKAAR